MFDNNVTMRSYDSYAKANRYFLLSLPKNLAKNTKSAVLISLHGLTKSAFY